MTLIYIPKTIETVEEAEGLPEGRIIRDVALGWEYGQSEISAGHLAEDLAGGVLVVALIPVEAEEETIRQTGYVNEEGYLVHSRYSDDPVHVATKTSFMTPWRPASS